MEAYGVFWALLELLFVEENRICITDYEPLAFGLQCDPNILKQVIEDFDLFIIEDDCFYSRRLNKHIEDINAKSKKAKDSVNKRWNNTSVIQTYNDSKGFDYYNNIPFPDYYDIHYVKRIEKDVNKTREYHKHLESLGYVKEINNYNGQTKWIKK